MCVCVCVIVVSSTGGQPRAFLYLYRNTRSHVCITSRCWVPFVHTTFFRLGVSDRDACCVVVCVCVCVGESIYPGAVLHSNTR